MCASLNFKVEKVCDRERGQDYYKAVQERHITVIYFSHLSP